MKCYWWNRWYHRRLREADVLWLLPALRLSAELWAQGKFAAFTEEWTRAIEARS